VEIVDMGTERIVCIIPARYGSTRLPGKPLADILGRPMILHVYERACRIPGMDRVVVATDDVRIMECIRGAGGEAMITGPDHPSGTDRIAEVARTLSLRGEDIVVNVQGDQPMLDPQPVLDIVTRLAAEPDLALTTPACPLDYVEGRNPNRVKVVVDTRWRALYFSRAPIPYVRDGEGDTAGHVHLRHLGLYAYRQEFLQTFVRLRPSRLEQIEKLEQLRALENGYSIGVVKVDAAPAEVDTLEDLQRVRSGRAG
jgi:3-deoxy-manno-octulosonate cytidylyltransferase (CMP-KDO synthetase)